MTPGAEDSKSRSNILYAGAGLVVIAILLLVFLGQDSEDTSCALATAGVVTISEGLSRGHSASSIMAKGALASTVPGACKKVVATFVEEPETEAEFNLLSSEGKTEESASGYELEEPVTAPPSESDAGHVIDCFISYRESDFLYRMCLEEVIAPA